MGERRVSRRKANTWTQDPEGVRRNILDVARDEFARNGLSGGRVDEIAARTATSKRMIYYYFGDKEGLYLAVLEEAYAGMRSAELALDLAALSPVNALRRLVEVTFDYHAQNSDFVRLVMVENIHQGRHLRRLEALNKVNLSAIQLLRDLYDRGVATGDFRSGLDPLHIHLTISALGFYNVSNRHSIREVFKHDMADKAELVLRRAEVVDVVLRYVVRQLPDMTD
ncbi:MAG: TetR family transcriptional regulator [Proteobacteria bacterium]|nr:TetR family transcriptional regulator [Pseudomonadota bacterium]